MYLTTSGEVTECSLDLHSVASDLDLHGLLRPVCPTTWGRMNKVFIKSENVYSFIWYFYVNYFSSSKSDFQDYLCGFTCAPWSYTGSCGDNTCSQFTRKKTKQVIVTVLLTVFIGPEKGFFFPTQKYWYFPISPWLHISWVLIRSALVRHF